MKPRPPLRGIKVIEFDGLAPGPFCGRILADYGADVIRVDKLGGSGTGFFAHGKRSIAIDVKKPAGIRILERLCTQADVMIDPHRPGVLEKLSLGPDQLMRKNPKLIYARLTGFGQTGPLSNRAGHDLNYIALSGILAKFGKHGGHPAFPVNLLADFAGGSVLCALGIVLALFERTLSGRGQVVDSSMTEGAAYVGSFLFESHNSFIWPKPDERGANWLDGGLPIYNTYETSDKRYMAVACLEPKFQTEFFQKMELDGVGDGAFSDPHKLSASLSAAFRSKTRDEWALIFADSDACVWPVLELDEASGHPQHRARAAFAPLPDQPDKSMPKPVPRLSRTPAVAHATHDFVWPPAPRYAEHSRDILHELGFTEEEILSFQNEHVVDIAEPKSKL